MMQRNRRTTSGVDEMEAWYKESAIVVNIFLIISCFTVTSEESLNFEQSGSCWIERYERA